MITRITARNFKRFDIVEVELGKTSVFIGPNNSGKTSMLQALALWYMGLQRWNEKRGAKTTASSDSAVSGKKKAIPEKRPGVTINRRDLISLPVPDANLLWRDLHVRTHETIEGKKGTKNIRIDITVQGISGGKEWECGFEFDYANAETFWCRPLRDPEGPASSRMTVPPEATSIQVAFLPPMSGLAGTEPKWEPGRINVLLGEGQTAQVLRNLCHAIFERSPKDDWRKLCQHILNLFDVELLPPAFIKERGEITMMYKEPSGVKLDLSSSGRGLQQTLLLLAYLYSNPKTILLLDEPDAHLEILRQQQIYQLLTDIAQQQGSQIVAASHSEVVLNEAAGRDVVVAFIGTPHRIDDRGHQVLKSLSTLGFDQYYKAEATGWVLYLEGSSDLAILRAFAKTLGHQAQAALELPFFYYVGTNLPQKAREHFNGLREAKNDLVGFALFDRLDKDLQQDTSLTEMMWKRREIENYLCLPEVLATYSRQGQPDDDLFSLAEANRRETAMKEAISEIELARQTLNQPGPWSEDIKVTDDFLNILFDKFFKKIGLPNIMRKSDYHQLAALVPKDKIDPEVTQKLDAIITVAKRAKPRKN